jgi:quercetin dioxygenase-like cupin family protein
MIEPGFAIVDAATGTRTVLIKGTREMSGRGWVLEVHCPEGAGPTIQPHMHTTWTESFEVVQGSATCRLGSEEHRLEPGRVVAVTPGVVHVHPWNTGRGEMVYRQVNDFGAATPDAVDDVLGAFATLNGLAREGRLGKNRLPKDPLQLAATLRTLTRHGGFDAAAPIWLQRGVSATLGRIAEAFGYRGVYDKYLA